MGAQLFSLSLLAATMAASGQTPGSISGIVVDAATNNPLAGAKVSLEMSTRETDTEGRFRFPGLKPRAYSLGAERQGFAKLEHHAVRLSPAEDVTNIVLRMAPESVISGRVLNAKGAPVRASIALTRADFPSHVASALTESDGLFRLGALPAGRYKLSAQAFTPASGQAALTFFPNAPTHREGEEIALKSGDTRSGITVTLRELSLVTIAGRFAGELPKAGRSSVWAVRADGESRGVSPTGPFDAENRFRLSLPPGAYRLKVNYWPQGARPSVLGFLDLTVPDSNLENIVIPSIPSRTVRARFKGPVTGETFFMLNPTERVGWSQWSKAAEDGTYVASDMSPDRYTVIVGGLPAGFYVQAILAGGADITTSGLDLITGTATDMEIILAPNGGTVGGLAPPGSSIWLSRISPHRAERELFHYHAAADAGGRFAISGIAPGEYDISYGAVGRQSTPQPIRVSTAQRLSLNFP